MTRERISSASIISSTAISEATEMMISGLRMLSDVDVARETNEEPDRSVPLLRHVRRGADRARRGDKRKRGVMPFPTFRGKGNL